MKVIFFDGICLPCFQLKDGDLQDKTQDNLRHKWFTLRNENKKFREAIENCTTGKKDYDCQIEDYINNKEEFKKFVDPKDEMSPNGVDVQYEAFVSSDVDQF